MEKELSSYLQISAEDFLLHATKFDLKPLKPALKTLICRIDPSSNLSASLPLALQASISRSIDSYKRLLESKSDAAAAAASPFSPPKKQVLRSSRRRKNAEGSGGEDESGSKGNSKKQFLVQSVEIYAYMLSLCISHPKNAFLDSDLLLSVQALHDSLVVFESSQDLQSAIANLCEEWWKGQLPGRETLISQSLPFLVSRSLTLLKKVDAHRVYALREAFSLLDFDDESIEDLKLLLVRCIVTPLYYKTEEGRRFIAYLFGLSEQFTKEALAIIRSQIPLGRKSALEAYADIVFRGWKVVEGSSKNELENVFLQNLVEGAIHASSPSLAASIRRIIGGFVNQRTTDGVEKLLFRLSEPVIFRSLQVANSNVRQNALHLLLDLFPLEDPVATKEDKDAMLDKQFFLLERLLQDECPGVRVVAVEGSCRILHLFWEIIPSSAITKTIANIVDDISHDVACEVRLSTLNGIMHMLGNPQTHEILKVLLPRLGDLFSDPVLAVRMAISDLLLALRDIRTFQFHKVVDIDALLSSLANDQPSVARKIARLLIPSYFPSKVTIEEACNRCITLIKRSPNAGARFCEFALAEGSSAKSIMELVKALVNLVASPNDLVSGVIEGVIDAAANLCKSLASEKTCKAELMLLFSGQKLKQLFAAAVTKHAQATVLDIASIVSPDNGIALTLTRECMALIKNCSGLPNIFEKQAEVRSAHNLMMSTGRFDEMLAALLDILQMAASHCCLRFGLEMPCQSGRSLKRKKENLSVKHPSKSKNVKGNKSVRDKGSANFQHLYLLAAGASWQIKDLLSSLNGRDAILKSPILEQVFSALKIISEASINLCTSSQYMDMSPVLAYTALCLHVKLQNMNLTGTIDGSNDKNDASKSAKLPAREMALDYVMNHLFSCIENLFGNFPAEECRKSSNLPSKSKHDRKIELQDQINGQRKGQIDADSLVDDGSSFTNGEKTLNLVKMVTAALKFIVDATTICDVSQNQERSLQFVSTCILVVISTLKRHSLDIVESKEEILKDMLVCLKSCFTYGAKLVNVVLKSSSMSSLLLEEASNLANNLINLIMSIESYVGSKRSACLIPVAKQWVPDLIIALCGQNIFTVTAPESDEARGNDQYNNCSLPWLKVLGNLELLELSNTNRDEDADSVPEPDTFSVFRKVVEMIVLFSRRNSKVLDSIGSVFSTGAAVLLLKEYYGLVLGLVHLICVKLVGHEHQEWDNLELMLASLQQLYPQLEKSLQDLELSEDARNALEKAKTMLHSACLIDIGGHGSGSMEEA
ncbi:hypothetical protein Syun_005235 [Stephania yunnanensis]|uniref:Condensin-2 complex subunit G2 n=1 Tax=Stephania yunnanensis TaxID=152371 RepID=A0AAP0Q216_9MAGN